MTSVGDILNIPAGPVRGDDERKVVLHFVNVADAARFVSFLNEPVSKRMEKEIKGMDL